ncbi:MAG: hypothetical protein JAZ18_01880 [Candidatus Thiodiazotropha endolucinida]|nr:hypothetical protein [Candidatus Thiodiazotropha endolucinida]
MHGSVQVERSLLHALRVVNRRYGCMAHTGSMPEMRHFQLLPEEAGFPACEA